MFSLLKCSLLLQRKLLSKKLLAYLLQIAVNEFKRIQGCFKVIYVSKVTKRTFIRQEITDYLLTANPSTVMNVPYK